MGNVMPCMAKRGRELLSAAETGDAELVRLILEERPELASYTPFSNTHSALHRAAAAGLVDVLCAVVVTLRAFSSSFLGAKGDAKGRTAESLEHFLQEVLNQRNSLGQTPLMLAAENGHALCVEYLLREQADPLLVDSANRSVIHYAAVLPGEAVLAALLDSNVRLMTGDGRVALKYARVTDMSGHCRYIDTRSDNGLTALHLAALSGELGSVRLLLDNGASMMVRTVDTGAANSLDVPPGSTPLHCAAMRGHVGIVQAMLQAHADAMGSWGLRTAAGQRAWENDGRIDLRSVTNTQRQLPYHVARARGHRNVQRILNPTVAIDTALEDCRDNESGYGPQRLATLAAYALRRGLLDCLKDFRQQKERKPSLVYPDKAAGAAASMRELDRAVAEVTAAGHSSSSFSTTSMTRLAGGAMPVVSEGREGMRASAECSIASSSSGPSSAGSLPISSPAAAAAPLPTVLRQPQSPSSGVAAPAQVSFRRQGSWRGDSPLSREADAAAGSGRGGSAAGGLVRAPSSGGGGFLRRRVSEGADSPLHPSTSSPQATASSGGPAIVSPFASYIEVSSQSAGTEGSSLGRISSPPSGAMARQASGGGRHGRQLSLPTLLFAQRNRSSELLPPSPFGNRALMRAHSAGFALASPKSPAASSGAGDRGGLGSSRRPSSPSFSGAASRLTTTAKSGLMRSLSFLNLRRSSTGLKQGRSLFREASIPGFETTRSVDDCGICLDSPEEICIDGCDHMLCVECAQSLCEVHKKPPLCPFCRRMIQGFHMP